MEDELKFQDLLVFIKDSRKILLFSILIPLIMSVFFFLFNPINTSETIIDNEVEIEDNQVINQLRERWNDSENEFTSEERELIDNIIDESSFYFEIYIENERSQPITNAYLIKNILVSDRVLENLDFDFNNLPSPDFMIKVQSINDTGIHRINIGTGEENSSENLTNAYFNALEENEIVILSEKNLNFLSDITPNRRETGLIEDDSISVFNVVDESLRIQDLILMIISILIISFLSGLLAVIIKLVFTDKITSLYNLRSNKNDKVIRMSHFSKFTEKETIDFIYSSLLYSQNENIILLIEKDTCEHIVNDINNKIYLVDAKNILILNFISQVEDKLPVEEVILFIEKNATSKNWYRKQRLQLEMLEISIKVILI